MMENEEDYKNNNNNKDDFELKSRDQELIFGKDLERMDNSPSKKPFDTIETNQPEND